MKFIAFFLGLVVTNISFGATTANLVLKGIVPELLSISLVSESVATHLPLDVSQVDLKVGEVTVKSNSVTGYNVRIESANLGKLKRTGGSENIVYTMKYGTSPVDLITGQTFTSSSASAVTEIKELKVSYTGNSHENLIAGEYTDTVTLTVTAN